MSYLTNKSSSDDFLGAALLVNQYKEVTAMDFTNAQDFVVALTLYFDQLTAKDEVSVMLNLARQVIEEGTRMFEILAPKAKDEPEALKRLEGIVAAVAKAKETLEQAAIDLETGKNSQIL